MYTYISITNMQIDPRKIRNAKIMRKSGVDELTYCFTSLDILLLSVAGRPDCSYQNFKCSKCLISG